LYIIAAILIVYYVVYRADFMKVKSWYLAQLELESASQPKKLNLNAYNK